jgi:hypothetical protein
MPCAGLGTIPRRLATCSRNSRSMSAHRKSKDPRQACISRIDTVVLQGIIYPCTTYANNRFPIA